MTEMRVYSIAHTDGPSRRLATLPDQEQALRWAHLYADNHPGALLLLLDDSPADPIIVATDHYQA